MPASNNIKLLATAICDHWPRIVSLYFGAYFFVEAPYFFLTEISPLLTVMSVFQILGVVFLWGKKSRLLIAGFLLLLASQTLYCFAVPGVIPPHIPVVNFFLLAAALARIENPQLARLPADLLFFLFVVIGLSHLTSGLTKFWYFDDAWVNGLALKNILETSAFAREPFASAAASFLPQPVLKLLSHGAVAAELSGGLMFFAGRARFYSLVALIFLHAGAVLFLALAQVSWGVIICLVWLWANCILGPEADVAKAPK
ncbi:MAG: hypothetical protein ACK5P7_07510 [Bdellovibrio sp.]